MCLKMLNYQFIFIINYQFQLCLSNMNTILTLIIIQIKSSVFPVLHLQQALVLVEIRQKPPALGTRCNRFLLYLYIFM